MCNGPHVTPLAALHPSERLLRPAPLTSGYACFLCILTLPPSPALYVELPPRGCQPRAATTVFPTAE